MAGDSVIFARPDNAAFDMTVHSAHRYNQVGMVNPGIRLFVASFYVRGEGTAVPLGRLMWYALPSIVPDGPTQNASMHFLGYLSPPTSLTGSFPCASPTTLSSSFMFTEQEIRTDPDTFYFSLVGTRPDPPRGPKLAATCAPGGRTGWTLWDWARLVTPNTSLKGLLTRLVYWVLRRLHVWQVR